SLSYLLLWWLARFYKLDDKMMQTIQRELSMRQQQGHSETHLPLNAVPEKA
ncbi:MFS transporter, partial [Acinetobacter baumannii]|nr:MFS transporter [Acinetobacter baumannii]